MRETDTARAETILRIVQSVPSLKAKPIKQWLAKAWLSNHAMWRIRCRPRCGDTACHFIVLRDRGLATLRRR